MNGNPVLVLVGTDSSIADDRSAPEQGSDLDALSRGSVGARDPFIGSAELPNGDYLVAVTNNSRMSVAMQQYQTATPANALIRLEPINSVIRLFVDRIGGTSPDTFAPAPVLFTTVGNNGGISASNTVPWTLADMTTYVVRNNGNGSQLVFANTMTGVQEAEISNFCRVNDTAMSPDGRLVGLNSNDCCDHRCEQRCVSPDQFNRCSRCSSDTTQCLHCERQSRHSDVHNSTDGQRHSYSNICHSVSRSKRAVRWRQHPQGDGILINGLTMYTATDASTTLFMFGVGSRANGQTSFAMPTFDANNAVNGISTQVNFNATNIVYKLSPDNGAAIIQIT